MKNNLKRTESLTAQSKQISKKNKFLMLYNKQMKRQKHTQLAMLLVITQKSYNSHSFSLKEKCHVKSSQNIQTSKRF